ncbi:putative P2Y purinoceptor 10 [Rhinophrynus dorsalis]
MQNASSSSCKIASEFQYALYSATFIIIFIPGLLANIAALWVLCSYINKKNKAIIFMINLSLADLAHVMSLPLRIYYYINKSWPFTNFLCLLCFYLKYLNMYASIMFLTLISIQRYVFTTNPFKAKAWKRRYDVAVSIVVWIVVGGGCSLFPLLRSSGLNNSNKTCFADLELKKLKPSLAMSMLTVAELTGFIMPIVVIGYCSLKTRTQLKTEAMQCQNINEKRKALHMVMTCAVVFFICFAPYHINFFFYMMIRTNMIRNCTVENIVLTFHPYSLCLANINCCLDPILYYFTASEFKNEVVRHGSRVMRVRLMSRESASSARE